MSGYELTSIVIQIGQLLSLIAAVFFYYKQANAAIKQSKSLTDELARASKKDNTDRINRTIELEKEFCSNDMLIARKTAWLWLGKLYKMSKIPSFKMLWDVDESVEDEGNEFEMLYKVIAFFYMVYLLGEREELDKDLALELFGYEYHYWSKRLEKLINATIEKEENLPECLIPMYSKIPWLINNKLNKKWPDLVN